MPRIRTIKPEFPQSESMGRVSRDARLLFVQLWTLCDDSGRTRGNSRMLASLLFPYDNDAPNLIDGWLDELDRESCIVRYMAEGSTYIEICNWLNHQKIDKPSQSKIPAFTESSRILANPREHSCVDQGPRTKGVDQGSGDQGPVSAPPASPATRAKKAKSEETESETELQAACRETWAAYCDAFFNRYGTMPVRNKTVNSQVKNFVQRLGYVESPAVAAFYVHHPQAFYVKSKHQFGMALKDAEGLRTEWATKRTVTDTQARQGDRLAANASSVDEAIRILESQGVA